MIRSETLWETAFYAAKWKAFVSTLGKQLTKFFVNRIPKQ